MVNCIESACSEIYIDDGFYVFLTIEGTSFKEVKVKVTDPNKTIRDQIASIVAVFELPLIDGGGNPIQYWLGQMLDDVEEPTILEFEDEDGREQSLIDYNIQPGDHLYLLTVPICGGILSYIYVIKHHKLGFIKWQTLISPNRLKGAFNGLYRLYGSINNFKKNLSEELNLKDIDDYFLAELTESPDGGLYYKVLNPYYYYNGNRFCPYGDASTFAHAYNFNVFSLSDKYLYPTLVLIPITGVSSRILKKIKQEFKIRTENTIQ